MKLLKRNFLHGFTFIVVILALVRCGSDIIGGKYSSPSEESADTLDVFADCPDIFAPQTADTSPSPVEDAPAVATTASGIPSTDNFPRHRFYNVQVYKDEFSDSNDVQIVAAEKYGVKVVQNRADAEKRKNELSYVGVNPYYHVGKLTTSIPYLVPRANLLLQDISKAFRDSLFVKGIPMHQIIVTSLLRTEEDVAVLRKRNRNASENSCHRFGTTFDIAYNHYVPFHTKKHDATEYASDRLKMVLAEVLRDMRNAGRCYVKYEVKQSCFHITTR